MAIEIVIAMENDHRNSEFFHYIDMVIFHSYVKLPDGILCSARWKTTISTSTRIRRQMGMVSKSVTKPQTWVTLVMESAETVPFCHVLVTTGYSC